MRGFSVAELDSLLERCISCGYCLPACPTYRLTADEASSPRGRISLMRATAAGHLDPADQTVTEQSAFCLGCRACEPVCPAGVQYGELLKEWRASTWRRKPLRVRALFALVNRSWIVRMAAWFRRPAPRRPGTGSHHLMLGCFERLLYPGVSRCVARRFPDLDVDPAAGCCGALHAHNGDPDRGSELARKLGERLPGTIVTTAGGCAAHLAEELGRSRVRELSQWIIEGGELDLDRLEPVQIDGRPPRIAIQDSCHLRNGLGVAQQIREIVARLGQLVELPSAAVCCGSAGSYSLLRPDDAHRVFEPKHQEVVDSGADVIVTVNPGCYRQVRSETAKLKNVRVIHLAELLDDSLDISDRQ